MTERLFVLGHPVGHSLSPAMHNAAYRALGLNWEYGFADYPTAEEAQAFLDSREWLALNITMPYKPLAFAAADVRSDAAWLAQGANVLVNCATRGNGGAASSEGGTLRADNTDGKGCVSYLRRCGVEFEGARAVVCGTGPTSLSIFHVLTTAGAQSVTLLGRDEGRSRAALDDYRRRLNEGGIAVQSVIEAGSYASHARAIEAADVIVDATSLGMKPNDPAPFDTGMLSSGQTVFDVVYGHGETALLAGARAAGCAAYDGLGMLVAQAVETVYDIVAWLDVPLDVPVDLQVIDLFEVMAEATR